MKTRIYIVRNKEADSTHLVRAQSVGEAIRHMVKNFITAEVAGQDDIIKATKANVSVEDVKEDK